MAEGKKSALIYADLIETIEKLTDDEAGRFFKHYLRYINDKSPNPPDRMTEIIFEPVKQQLKRDLVKWEDVRAIKSNSGHLGGLASAKARKSKQIEADASKSQAKQAVSVNDNDNVNVNVIVNAKDVVESKKTSTSPFDLINIDILKGLFLKNDEWQNVSRMSLGIEKEDIKARLEKFNTHLQTSKDLAKTEQDYAKHFISWTRIQMRPKVINGKSVSGFPNGWDQNFFNSLKDGAQISKYTQHLHSIGLRPKKNHRGEVIDWIPKENAQG